MSDNRRYSAKSVTDPAFDAFSITPGATELTHPLRGIWVGGAGDIEITTPAGNDVVLKGAQAGSILPVRATHVLATSTTATDLVGLF